MSRQEFFSSTIKTISSLLKFHSQINQTEETSCEDAFSDAEFIDG